MRFAFSSPTSHKGQGALMPYLPLTLLSQGHNVKNHGLLDTGAAVNVLPFSMGLHLGAVWDEQKIPLQLGGNLATSEARALFVNVAIGQFPAVQLAFAWTKADNVPLLLGQTNFFMEFDVLFARSACFFEVFPRGTHF